MDPITTTDGCTGWASRFICMECDVDFDRSSESTTCPHCGCGPAADFAPYYIEQDPEEADLIAPFEFGEGD